MPNNQQFKLRTKFIGTRDVHEYRQTIGSWVCEQDTILEIGCEWGTTTMKLAPACHRVIGTDVSQDCIDRARREHPECEFDVLDAFDVRAAVDLAVAHEIEEFTKIYIDMSGLSGYRSLLDTISLLTMYATVLRPEAIIIKSASLKHFANLCQPWRGHDGVSRKSQQAKT
ncbi:MAG: class I SAM-dependent methyltransferase [Gemmatimonadetes bacterium]|nr:class I SAM-dependent methyltransferase [Gemmatimonadota bacterium]MBT7859337.1 class I SAM-dependent methyltransferase [Gemmatimonadota bacterium]